MKKFPQAIRELSCLPPSDAVNAVSLSAGAAESIKVPDGARYVVLSCTDNFYARYDGTAAAVPGDVSDGTASELNPTMRDMQGVGTISVISPADCVLTAAFYGV